jgi:hypothetical protein
VSQVPGSWNTHVTWRMAFPRVSVCVCIMCVGTRSVTDAYCGEMRGVGVRWSCEFPTACRVACLRPPV